MCYLELEHCCYTGRYIYLGLSVSAAKEGLEPDHWRNMFYQTCFGEYYKGGRWWATCTKRCLYWESRNWTPIQPLDALPTSCVLRFHSSSLRSCRWAEAGSGASSLSCLWGYCSSPNAQLTTHLWLTDSSTAACSIGKIVTVNLPDGFSCMPDFPPLPTLRHVLIIRVRYW